MRNGKKLIPYPISLIPIKGELIMAFRFEDCGAQTATGLTLNTFAAESSGALNSYARVTAIFVRRV